MLYLVTDIETMVGNIVFYLAYTLSTRDNDNFLEYYSVMRNSVVLC